ncbi:hypothetical protein CDAR_278021 [Caerostris darwini]|uniref:Uncharacterized protein n=1 Tax=Caerostris darwini TaxID=1538125 RepID=A0AAV4UAS6_9ARAC|nr:hypothetical protein CDAR_278021 [Caerostris darwini]
MLWTIKIRTQRDRKSSPYLMLKRLSKNKIQKGTTAKMTVICLSKPILSLHGSFHVVEDFGGSVSSSALGRCYFGSLWENYAIRTRGTSCLLQKMDEKC